MVLQLRVYICMHELVNSHPTKVGKSEVEGKGKELHPHLKRLREASLHQLHRRIHLTSVKVAL